MSKPAIKDWLNRFHLTVGLGDVAAIEIRQLGTKAKLLTKSLNKQQMQNCKTSARTAAQQSSKCPLLFRPAALAAILLLAAGLSSCGDSFNSDKCWQQVQTTFPKSTVWKMPDKNYAFIVVDSCGAVYYVKTMNDKTTEVTSKVTISPCR
jgi:hypothetical protein